MDDNIPLADRPVKPIGGFRSIEDAPVVVLHHSSEQSASALDLTSSISAHSTPRLVLGGSGYIDGAKQYFGRLARESLESKFTEVAMISIPEPVHVPASNAGNLPYIIRSGNSYPYHGNYSSRHFLNMATMAMLHRPYFYQRPKRDMVTIAVAQLIESIPLPVEPATRSNYLITCGRRVGKSMAISSMMAEEAANKWVSKLLVGKPMFDVESFKANILALHDILNVKFDPNLAGYIVSIHRQDISMYGVNEKYVIGPDGNLKNNWLIDTQGREPNLFITPENAYPASTGAWLSMKHLTKQPEKHGLKRDTNRVEVRTTGLLKAMMNKIP